MVGVDTFTIFAIGQFLVRSSASLIGFASLPLHKGYLSISSSKMIGTDHDANSEGDRADAIDAKPPRNLISLGLDRISTFFPKILVLLRNIFFNRSSEKLMHNSSSGSTYMIREGFWSIV